MEHLLPRRRFDVDEYHWMARVSVIGRDERTELIDGDVVEKDGGGQRKRFTVEEYHAMVYAGILYPDERVELIEGEVVLMPPIGSLHNGIVTRLTRFLVKAVGDDAIVQVQGALRLNEYSELQPDFALLRPQVDDYTRFQPLPSDVLFLVEVSDTTLRRDRDVKLPLYALAGIREVWIVDLRAGAVQVYRSLEGESYREHTTYRRGDTVTTSALPGLELRLDELLA